ncbi:hypothetical protein H8959_017059 [Pygathrix nigripes]
MRTLTSSTRSKESRAQCHYAGTPSARAPWQEDDCLRLGPEAALTGLSLIFGEVSSQRMGLRARSDWAGDAVDPALRGGARRMPPLPELGTDSRPAK